MRSSTTDFGAGLFSLITAAVFYAQAGDLEGVGLMYPQLIVGFITLGGVYLMGLGLYKRARNRDAARDDEPVAMRRVLLISGLSIAYVALISVLGFFSASALFLSGSAVALNDTGKGPRHAVAAALVLTLVMCLAIWLGFGKLLKVPTPEGLLF